MGSISLAVFFGRATRGSMGCQESSEILLSVGSWCGTSVLLSAPRVAGSKCGVLVARYMGVFPQNSFVFFFFFLHPKLDGENNGEPKAYEQMG